MDRLPLITERELDHDQRLVWDTIAETRKGVAAVDPDGGLIGPFNAMITSPRIGLHQARLGAELRFNTSFERRLGELVICTVGAHWRSEFEFWAHSTMAVEHGVPTEVIQALADGREPQFERADEATVFALTRRLLEHGRISDDLYQEGLELLGHRGMVELVALVGHYCTICLTLNVFDIPLPEGEQPIWTTDRATPPGSP
ncbi:MAG: carboxymuconolactone decarboxylase family protein [Acidimicrobiia bacterium]|nr:carboxymuconolactone decarboxylase family protein [Acidimicrobiia bacterium]